MRKELKKLNNERITVVAMVSRLGTKKAYRGNDLPTVLLTNIKDKEGNELTNHLWLNLTKGFSQSECSIGDTIKFQARVKSYTKGYKGYREDVYNPISVDYKLSHPTKFIKVINGFNG